MRVLAYRVLFETPEGAGGVTFAVLPAVPEVIASGRSREDALAEAERGLEAALRYRCFNPDIPLPEPDGGADGDAHPVVIARPMTAAKAFVIYAHRASGLSKSEVARRTGLDESEVRRVLDPRHASKIARISEVSAALGHPMTVALAA